MKRFSQRGLSLLLALAAVICLANPVRAAGSDDALEAADGIVGSMLAD